MADSKQNLKAALLESMRRNGDPTKAQRDLGIRGPRLAAMQPAAKPQLQPKGAAHA
jgi:hypothetical protein